MDILSRILISVFFFGLSLAGVTAIAMCISLIIDSIRRYKYTTITIPEILLFFAGATTLTVLSILTIGMFLEYAFGIII